MTASKCQPDVFWTHNDSGGEAFIYAFNLSGANLGTFRVKNAENVDWEDIAAYRDAGGKCFLYIGEIGDNDLKRSTHAVYRIVEPEVGGSAAGTTEKNAQETAPADALVFRYPDQNQNSETLMVHPSTGNIYIVSKSRTDPAGVYKLSGAFGTAEIQTARRIASLQLPSIPVGLLTGGDIAVDGRRVVLCDYLDGYELSLATGDNFDDIWKQPFVEVDLGERDTGEAVTYGTDNSTIYATTEGKKAPIIMVRRKS